MQPLKISNKFQATILSQNFLKSLDMTKFHFFPLNNNLTSHPFPQQLIEEFSNKECATKPTNSFTSHNFLLLFIPFYFFSYFLTLLLHIRKIKKIQVEKNMKNKKKKQRRNRNFRKSFSPLQLCTKWESWNVSRIFLFFFS